MQVFTASGRMGVRQAMGSLTASVVGYLRSQVYDPTAERRTSILPLGGIYWSDEIPDFKALLKLPREDARQVYRLFAIRMQLWKGENLSVKDQEFWKQALEHVPTAAMFQRLNLSDHDRQAQLDSERSSDDVLRELAGEADDFVMDKDGSFSATFDLTKDKRQPIGERIRSWWYRMRS